MKILLSLLLFPTILSLTFSCKPSVRVETEITKTDTPEALTFDSTLAQQLGADEYGMKKYVIAFLKKGPNRDQDSAQADELQRAHMDNIGRLANEGKLALAGPFLDTGALRGIYIFNVESLEEAKRLTETDPAVQAGRLVLELHPWYGSAATSMIPEQHKKIAKKQI